MTVPKHSRRAFLRTLIASASTGVFEFSFPGSLLAANDPAVILPHFVTGTVDHRTAKEVVIDLQDAPHTLITVVLTSSTEICRRSCDAQWNDLKKGDRVEAGTYLGDNGLRFATWIVAFPLAEWGVVKDIQSTSIVIGPDDDLTYGSMGVDRELEIGKHTLSHGRKQVIQGAATNLEVGDYVYYTATGDVPDYKAPKMWALRLFRMESLDE